MVSAAKAKQHYDWDHTADILAMLATLHTTKSYSRADFHPFIESKLTSIHLDDPAAEYHKLKAEEAKHVKRNVSSTSDRVQSSKGRKSS